MHYIVNALYCIYHLYIVLHPYVCSYYVCSYVYKDVSGLCATYNCLYIYTLVVSEHTFLASPLLKKIIAI